MLVGLLSACQTSSQTGLQGKLAQEYEELVASRCFVGKIPDGSSVMKDLRKLDNGVIVYSIVEGKSFWRRVDVSSKGVRGNIYHNPMTGKFICGWRNWRQANMPDVFENVEDISYEKKVDTDLLAKADPNQKVVCNVLKSYVGGDRHIVLFEDECIKRKGDVIRKIQALPPDIDGLSYVKCLPHDEEKPVTMTAVACVNSGGEIVADEASKQEVKVN